MELANGVYNIDAKSFADPYGNGVQRFDRLTKCVQLAVKGLGDNTTSAIEVAKALYTIREEKLYENYPVPGTNYLSVFEDFVSFAKAFFCAGKSTIYNYIALYERFGADSKAEENPQNTFDVSKYTYTQLLLLLSLSDSELIQAKQEVKPNWTKNEVKKYVKEVKERRVENSNRLEKVEVEEVEDVAQLEEPQYEAFALNNDDRRREFLKTYKRWTKCAECDVLNTHVVFYGVCLIDTVYLVAVNTLFDEFDEVSFYKFNMKQPVDDPYYRSYYGHYCLDMRWATSDNEIINFLREKKIKSIDILKNGK